MRLHRGHAVDLAQALADAGDAGGDGRRHWARGMERATACTVSAPICDGNRRARRTARDGRSLRLDRMHRISSPSALALPGRRRPASASSGDRAAPAPAVAARTTTVGVADQHGETFSDPLFTALGVKHARLNLAWDALDYDWQLDELDNWMAQAQAAGVQPLVIFSQSRVKGRTRLLPTPGAVRQGRRQASGALPVRDASSRPGTRRTTPASRASRRPEPSPQFYKMLRTKCPSCNVLPASLLDNPNLVPWTLSCARRSGSSASPSRRLWGLHNYSDVNRLKDTSTRKLLAAVKGKVWITETGGVVDATSPTASKFPQGAAYAGR